MALTTPGSIFEVLYKSDGEFIRLAYVSDLLEGFTQTLSLQNLDSINFLIPFDRFVAEPTNASTPGFLRQLQQAWQSSHSTELPAPYDKMTLVKDHVYIRYTQKDRERLYRIATLDENNDTELAGTAVDAAVQLTDFLTQYKAGRSQFIGQLPSEIAQRILDGDQQVQVINRRFAPDSPIRLTLANEIPDMTPSNPGFQQPTPMVVEVRSVNPNDVALFSGLPHETISPAGSTRDLATGKYYVFGFNDYIDNPVGSPQERPGFFKSLVFSGEVTAPINFSSTGAFTGLEANAGVSHVIFGCVKADLTGPHAFTFTSEDGARVYFRGQKVVDHFDDARPAFSERFPRPYSWVSDLVEDVWYPFIIHHRQDAKTQDGTVRAGQTIRLEWLPGSADGDDASRVLVPADSLSSELNGGYFPVRFADNDGVIRYYHAYKGWDGRAIFLAVPIMSIFPDYIEAIDRFPWCKGVAPGALVEEVKLPIEHPQASVLDWGTGWTRRPGPIDRNAPGPHNARFAQQDDDATGPVEPPRKYYWVNQVGDWQP